MFLQSEILIYLVINSLMALFEIIKTPGASISKAASSLSLEVCFHIHAVLYMVSKTV